MTTEIRLISEDELNRAHFILAYAFTGDRAPEKRFKHVERMGPAFGLYEDGEMAACLRIFPLRMFIHGAPIPLGGVSSVACLPEHRRKGYVGQLLRHALETMREESQPLSALYTPHPSLYRRYGWMFASSAIYYRFNPKDIEPVNPARPTGRVYRVTEEEWPTVAEVHREFAAPRNGYLDRDERWWKEAFFRGIYDEKRRPRDVAVWADSKDQPRGYVAYHSAREERPEGPSLDRVIAEEFVALDADAHGGLLRYLVSHDLAEEVLLWGPVDDPLTLAVGEPWRIKREHWYGFMLRVVDVEKAVAARPPARSAPEGAFTVHIADAAAPWNGGVWRVECSDGKLSAEKAVAAPDLTTDAAAFAAMFNGYLRPTEAVRTGLAEGGDVKAVGRADRILAADYAPYPSEMF